MPFQPSWQQQQQQSYHQDNSRTLTGGQERTKKLAAVITAGLLLLYIPLCYEDFHFHVAHVYARLGYPNAQHILGQRYLQGAGVEKNEDMAMHWFSVHTDHEMLHDTEYPFGKFGSAVLAVLPPSFLCTCSLPERGKLKNPGFRGSGETPECGSSPWAPRSSATVGKCLQEQKPSLNDCCNTDAGLTLSSSALSNSTFSLLSV
ncbi:hypothetical protein DUI87_08862 [Hirundo rustica rustica]|uniref:Uncharacterized protein n=1 Tax=Hirundo rustica rustica TaxID=333673 RepID=A0A3M0KSR0_HIRRU|nr:hypothetical protein DUI87_08862 [Hirundo rustica rustica]